MNNWYWTTHQYNYIMFSISVDRDLGKMLWKGVRLRVLGSVGKNIMFGLAEFLDERFSVESVSSNRENSSNSSLISLFIPRAELFE